jgi:hypothetical protein
MGDNTQCQLSRESEAFGREKCAQGLINRIRSCRAVSLSMGTRRKIARHSVQREAKSIFKEHVMRSESERAKAAAPLAIGV